MKIIKFLITLFIVPLMVSCGGSACSERVSFGIIANNLCGQKNESSQKQIENNKIKNGAGGSSAGVLISF